MDCSLHRALQGTLAIVTRVRPKDLEEAPTGAGPAGQLAAFLRRAV